jgi:hypothetical protein
MDILYSGKVDGFCIVSSDSDFTRLAIRLREAGMKVFGFGEKKTPTAFISACDKFVYIEILTNAQPKPVQKARRSKRPGIAPAVPEVETEDKKLGTVTRDVVKVISDSVEDLADESGWAYLGDLGNLLIKKQPDFDPRNYGFQKLVLLIKSLKIFDIEKRETGKSNVKHVYVKLK